MAQQNTPHFCVLQDSRTLYISQVFNAPYIVGSTNLQNQFDAQVSNRTGRAMAGSLCSPFNTWQEATQAMNSNIQTHQSSGWQIVYI